ncbi:MAG: hypothetical protein ACI845_001131 [Gammaproteobacteria bacterium]|jgi:hypothetical protein
MMTFQAQPVRSYRPDLVTLLTGSLVIWIVGDVFFQDDIQHIPIEPADNQSIIGYSNIRQQALEVDRQLAAIKTNSQQIDPAMFDVLNQSNHKQFRFDLLRMASDAVERGDQLLLANTLLTIGEASINALDLIDAESYLNEALLLADELGDMTLKGRCYQQLGHLNIKQRNLARRSAYAYDQLLIARNRIALDQTGNTYLNLQTIISDNLEIKRLGAAASAWETMSQFHAGQHDSYQASLAIIEAAKLYAVSGRALRAKQLIGGLSTEAVGPYEKESLELEINQLEQQHERDNHLSANARDYLGLYNHYKNKGDELRAWEFRLKANQSLLKTSQQSMYLRQPDVMAILYNSNFAMDRAKIYLQQANKLFIDQNDRGYSHQTQEMQKLVY